MAKLSQEGRPLQVFTPLGQDAIFLVGVSGTEAISDLFEFKLELVAENAKPVPFDKILGQEVTVACQLDPAKGGDLKRYVHGIVGTFRQLRRDLDYTYYEAVLVPKMWLLRHQVRCRIFHQKTIGEILHAVLEPLRPHVRVQLTQAYPVRDYTVQYEESDFAFVSRLMEQEGIWYHFEHGEKEHVLVVHDSAVQVESVPEQPAIRFDDGRGGGREVLRVVSWEKEQTVRAAKYKVRDYHFQAPKARLEAATKLADKVKAGAVEHALVAHAEIERVESRGGQAHHHEGIGPAGEANPDGLKPVFDTCQRYAKLRAEQAASESFTLTASSTCWHFLPGRSFELRGHFDGDGWYLLTRIRHEIHVPLLFESGVNDSFHYENHLTALPAAIPFRPARTMPWPRIDGFQTAVVVGPKDHEIFLDPYGRIKVQFHWDAAGDHHGSDSCWLRVAQVWAGNNWGAFFWPRVGHEVVVAFENGDPDRPLVVGSVYNEVNRPPVHLPADARMGGIKSCTFGGDPHTQFNAVVFHDTLGVEHVQVHSETNDLQASETFRYEFAPQASIAIHGSI